MKSSSALTPKPYKPLEWIHAHKSELILVGVAAGTAMGGYLAYCHMRQSTQDMLDRGYGVKHTLKIGNLVTYTVEGKPVPARRREQLKIVHIP